MKRADFKTECIIYCYLLEDGCPAPAENNKIIGANVTSEKARVDFEYDGNLNEIIPELTKMVKEIIDKDLEVITDFQDKDTHRRFWQVAGIGTYECGGTHLNRTGEIGDFELKRVNLGKGKERLECLVIDR